MARRTAPHPEHKEVSLIRLLGHACGQEDGSAEVLLKATLTAAAREGTAVEMVRLTDLPLAATADAGDDAAWFCDRLLDADGVIVSSPTYTRSAPGALKLLIDRAFGPRTDVVLVREALAHREHGRAGQKETCSLLGLDTTPPTRGSSSRAWPASSPRAAARHPTGAR